MSGAGSSDSPFLSAQEERDGLEAKCVAAAKPALRYASSNSASRAAGEGGGEGSAASDAAAALATWQQNCERVLARLVRSAGLLERAWWPHAGAGTLEALAATCVRAEPLQAALSLNALERSERGTPTLRWLQTHRSV